MKALPISVVILTKNEEQDLPACLDSLTHLSDDIHVIDSGSQDRTWSIAESHGASVYSNPFRGFGEQRNWAIDNAKIRYPLVLHFDADERTTPSFISELSSLCKAENQNFAGWHVPSKLMLGDRWLKYSVGYPVYQVRLHQKDRLRFENHGHGQREKTSGRLGYIKEPYLHYAFSKGLDAWFIKHVAYAAAEAAESRNSPTLIGLNLRLLFSADPVIRRRALKRLSFHLPYRGTFRFLQMILLKRGILDGRAGWQYARMISCYESMIECFVKADEA